VEYVREIVYSKLNHLRGIEIESIACFISTNPVFFVFGLDVSTPIYVVRRYTDKSLCENYLRNSKILAQLMPHNIATPIDIFEGNKHFYYVEKGVPGIPLNKICFPYTKLCEWDDLQQKASQSLSYFREKLKNEPNLSTAINLSQELKQCYLDAHIRDIETKELVKESIAHYCSLLAAQKLFDSLPQHGDFCLNNLVFDKGDIYYIDLEDFGKTTFPMFDEFSLAISLFSRTPEIMRLSMKLYIKEICINSSKDMNLDSKSMPALFLYYLLFRLGDWSKHEKREQYCNWIEGILKDFLVKPNNYF
jgi:hypothetical protein